MECREEMNKLIPPYPESETRVLRNAYIAVLQNEIKRRLKVYPRNDLHERTETQFNTLFGQYGFTLTIDYAPPNFDDPDIPGPETAFDTNERRGYYPDGPPSNENKDPSEPPPGMSTRSAYYTIVNNLHRRLCALERRK